MIRDFSETRKMELLGLITISGTGEAFSDAGTSGQRTVQGYFAGAVSCFEWIDRLGIGVYLDNLNAYEGLLIEKSEEAKDALNRIWDEISLACASYDRDISELVLLLGDWNQFLKNQAERIVPEKGMFDAGAVTFALAQMSAQIQELQSRFLSYAQAFAFSQTDGDSSSPVSSSAVSEIEELLQKAAGELTQEQKLRIIGTLLNLAQKHRAFADLAETNSVYGNLPEQIPLQGLEPEEADLQVLFGAGTKGVSWERTLLERSFQDGLFIKLLKDIETSGQNKESFAYALLGFASSQSDLELFGTKAYGEMNKLLGFIPLGSVGLTEYIAQVSDEHTRIYGSKVDVEFSTGFSGKASVGEYQMTPAFYADGEIRASLAQSAWYNESGAWNAGVDAQIGNAFADAKVSVGFYARGDDESLFSPCVDAKVGAGVSAIELCASGQVSNGTIGLYGSADVDILEAEVGGQVSGVLFDEAGNFDPQLYAKVSAQANAADVSGSVGVSILGADIGITGGVSVGVGAHAQIGYKEGHFSMDVGASLGVGVNFGLDVDVAGLMKGVSAFASNAWSAISGDVSQSWEQFVNNWNAFWSGL